MVESSKPKKQRKKLYAAALHKTGRRCSAHLSKELRKSLGRRSVEIRSNDKVKIVRGSKKGFSGKVLRMNRKKNQIFIEKLNRKKADGSEVPLPIQPSNVLVIELDRSDERRFKGKKIEKKEPIKEKKEKVKKGVEKSG